jgi:hypothetical protein
LIKVKSGVTPKMLVIAAAAANTAEKGGFEVVITSGTDGTHKRGSKHYSGDALDFRTSNLTLEQRKALIAGLMARLGDDYDIILERDHLHVEYDVL